MDYMRPDYWPANTRVELCKVPWDASYRDVVIFDDKDDRDTYFRKISGEGWLNDKFRYLKPYEPIRVPIPYSTAYQYNYAVVTNAANPVPGEGEVRALYYFIVDSKYINPQVCELTVVLDVMMTYQDYICLGNMYVESGHMGVANTNVPDDVSELTGQTLYNYMAIDEGISVGQQYTYAAREWFPLNIKEQYDHANLLGRIIVVSTVNLAADPGDVNNPNLDTSDGQMTDGLPSGCNVYTLLGNDGELEKFMKELSKKSWAAQGIVSISTYPGALLTDGPEVELFGNSGIKMHFLGESPTLRKELIDGTGEYDKEYRFETENVFTQLAKGFEGNTEIKKLFSYPYSVIELSCWNGNPVYLKPELLQGNKVVLFAIGCALAPFARVGIFPYNYNTNGKTDTKEWTWVGFGTTQEESTRTGVIPAGDFFDSALWITNFPQFSIVNNNYLTYMASTANTREYLYQSAGWSLDKANATAQNEYEIAQRNIATNWDTYNNSIGGLLGNLSVKGDGLVNNNLVAGAALGGVYGATYGYGRSAANALASAQNSANAATNSSWGTQTLQNLTGYTSQANSQALAGANASANYQLANYANRGDYANAIRGINATYQDAALKPPSTVGEMGGDGFMWKNGLVGFAVTYKTVSGAAYRTLTDYFRRYGYKINRWHNFNNAKLSDLKVMSKFSYWKVLETYLTCAYANETEKDTIRGVLEKGVTVWDNPDDIGNTVLEDNTSLRNISY